MCSIALCNQIIGTGRPLTASFGRWRRVGTKGRHDGRLYEQEPGVLGQSSVNGVLKSVWAGMGGNRDGGGVK